MFKTIEYEVIFAKTARFLKESVVFQKGFGTITGPNESGKSFMLEAIRWCLFGTAALRGAVSEYKKLTGALVFVIKGEEYSVTRSLSNATLRKGNTVLAVGTSPVNAKIVAILGFGLDVFDISCSCGQDQLNKLGEMKPTERKKMVDSVIGMGVIDILTDMATSENRELSRDARTIREVLRTPSEPEKPDNYETASTLVVKVDKARELTARKNHLEGVLSQIMEMPEPPTPSLLPEASELKAKADKQAGLKSEIQRLEGLKLRLPAYSAGEIDRYEKAIEAKAWLKNHPKPAYTQDALDALRHQKENHTLWLEHSRLSRLAQRLQDAGENECPSCGHKWSLEQDQLDKVHQQMMALPEEAWIESIPVLVDIDLEETRLRNWLEVEDKWNKLVEYENVPVPAVDFVQERKNLEHQSDYSRLDSLRSDLSSQPNYGNLLQNRINFDTKLASFVVAKEKHNQWMATMTNHRRELADVISQLTPLTGVTQLYSEALLYENQLGLYEHEKAEYDAQLVDVVALETEAEEWKKAKLAMVDFRTKVKQHLIPSLNIAASVLIKQMTGGQRQVVKVDDDFEIEVDGQPIHTLSGSGKAVANLALRIGLGRVLTNGILSVFIGDEIDGSMDEQRVENTSLTMKKLSSQVSQILLITHKYPEADYYINLGNANAQQEQS